MVYALDSTSIRICLELSSWAEFHHGDGCVKMHTLIDLRGSIPSYIVMTNGLVHDSKVMPMIPVEEQVFYLMGKFLWTVVLHHIFTSFQFHQNEHRI